MTTLILALILCISASAAEERAVIDNVVYELTENKTYGQHYVATDFFENEEAAKTATKVTIVDEINGIEVMGINTNISENEDMPAYVYTQEYPNITRVSLPTTIKYIGAYAFTFFPGVERLALPIELEYISEGAFFSMDSLKSITLPTAIPDYAFSYCKNLEKVVLKKDITTIGVKAFIGCEKLTSINLPSTLENIGAGAFSGTAFKKVVLPAGVSLHDSAFDGCESLEKLVFEGNDEAKYISFGSDTFYGCNNLKAVYIKTIPSETILATFEDLPALKDIYFAGSEELWNKLTSESARDYIAYKGIKVHFYYRHSHSFVKSGSADCKKGGTYTYSCKCGDSFSYAVSKSEAEHSFGNWKVTKKSTYTVAGTKQRTCSVCKKVEKKTIAKLKLYTGSNYKISTADRTESSITLSWNAVDDATGYRVYQKNSKTGKYERIASIKGKTAYTVKNLEEGKTYSFTVQPYHKDSKGNVAFGEQSRPLSESPRKSA